ncbi:MAG TPA: diguanylate cyclase [Burkholderiales bacterium]|jgi:diguanylate cyclase (GGDEF)-like protein
MDSRPRVLIVDDSKVVRTSLAKVIRGSFDVAEAGDGEAGWTAIEGDPTIVAVISDLGMPKLDGMGLLGRIRSHAQSRIRDLPFLVISGNEDDDTREKARGAGANDFITKSTKGAEAIARIDNLLRLVKAKHDLEASQQALKVSDDDSMWDALTGAFTSAYLMTEGGKLFSHSKRHGQALAVVSFRIDNYPDIEAKVGKEPAGKLLANIAKLVQSTLRAEDSMGRMGPAQFTAMLPSTDAAQAVVFARRLRERLDTARITHANEAVRIRTSFGVSAMGHDNPGSIDDLLKIAGERLEKAAAKSEEQRAAAPMDFGATLQRATGNDVDLAIKMLDKAAEARASEVLDKLGPLIKTTCSRVGIDLQEFLFLLQSKQ